jgi:DNA-binding MarR family transcriptional regulator
VTDSSTPSGSEEERVGYVIARVQADLRTLLNAALRPLNISVAQYAILKVLGEAKAPTALTNVELARRCFITAPSASELVRTLVNGGLIERLLSQRDARIVMLRLTPLGRRVLRTATEISTNRQRAILRDLTVGEQRTLLDLLHRLQYGVERVMNEKA